MSQNKKQNHSSKRFLQIAIGVVSILLVVLVAVTVILSGKRDSAGGQNVSQTTQPTAETGPSAPTQPDDNRDPQNPVDPQTPDSNIPTESAPMLLDQGLYIVHVGNYSGKYVEDGSDSQLENFCAVMVENRSGKAVQLLQFKITSGDHVYEFRLTTLPAGERAIVQDLNRASFVGGEATMTADVEVCVFFDAEPSLYEDVFAISGTERGIELRNLTDVAIPGPIYVYYKTRTADGYFGGITYRVTIPGLEANATYSASVSHFWPGSSQVMFADYAH